MFNLLAITSWYDAKIRPTREWWDQCYEKVVDFGRPLFVHIACELDGSNLTLLIQTLPYLMC